MRNKVGPMSAEHLARRLTAELIAG